ncbi:MAG: haloacid dehalogenase-like hydrolase [Promicromonosporaceae bacterium]|nr:haloacid dehalogenase-like hydrolase [Promicromonosporaceae bacterium]
MKRLISAYASDIRGLEGAQLKKAIQASEGRVVAAEDVVTTEPLLAGVTNAEVMAAFGADLILLNEFDVFTREIVGLPPSENPIAELKRLTGRPIGVNLEPIGETDSPLESLITISAGRQATAEAFAAVVDLGIDFLVLTGNPATGVTTAAIKNAITSCRQVFGGLLLAGKMHGAGVAEDILDVDDFRDYLELGADGVLMPAVNTVPGITEAASHAAAQAVKKAGGIVMCTIGTSQESADEATIREIGLTSKRVGADIHHLGDGSFGRMPTPENIMTLSIAIRGKRHTFFRMAASPLR